MAWRPLVEAKLARMTSRRRKSIVVALLVLGLALGGAAAWYVANPPTTAVTEEVDQQVVRSSVETSARVTADSTMFARGTVLRDRQVYFERPTPDVTVSVTASGPPEHDFAVSHDLSLTYRVVIDESAVWERAESLAGASAEPSDGRSTVSATLSVPAIRERAKEIESEAGGSADVRVSLAHRVDYRTDNYDGSLVATAPLELGSGTYALGDGLSDEARLSRTVTRPAVDREAGHTLSLGGLQGFVPERSIVAGSLAMVLLILSAVVEVAAPRQADPSALERRLTRLRYADWISEGRIDSYRASGRVEAASLADLVDIAIDSNRRVVFDPEYGVYGVIVDDVRYYYEEGPGGGYDDDDDGFQWGSSAGVRSGTASSAEGGDGSNTGAGRTTDRASNNGDQSSEDSLSGEY